jgi:hypothetical protein
MQDNTINHVALRNASRRVILRRVIAMKAVEPLMENVVDGPKRVSEMRAKSDEMMVKNRIRIAIPP